MAENGPATPEKQLLKLIEDPKAVPAKKQSARTRGAFSLSGALGIFLGRLSFWRRSSRTRRPGPRMLDLGLVNRVLALAAVGLLGYVSFDAASSAVLLSKPPTVTIPSRQTAGGGVSQSVSPLKESAFYLEKVSSRDIFKEGPRPAAAPEASVESAAPVEDVSGDFSLVGISWSANPDVIIENKSESKTYFVKRGQPVGSGAKLEAVFKDHVIISREGREFELR